MKRDKIKPCPFCGAEAKFIVEEDHHGGYFELGCPDEECCGHWAFYTEPIHLWAEAVKRWNRRAK